MMEDKDRDSQPEYSTPEEIQEKKESRPTITTRRLRNVLQNSLLMGEEHYCYRKFAAPEHTALVPPFSYAVICKFVNLLPFNEENMVS
jgi:hypothetical protein